MYQREESRNNDDYDKIETENIPSDDHADNEVQVVLTPRSQKEVLNQDVVPNLKIRTGESLESIKTNKRAKKFSKSKKKPNITKTNEEPLKTSLIYSAKTKRKKFHGRLKNSNSKSTVATRESNFSDKKPDRRKFKRQKSNNL